jgi:hypothetical protein
MIEAIYTDVYIIFSHVIVVFNRAEWSDSMEESNLSMSIQITRVKSDTN